MKVIKRKSGLAGILIVLLLGSITAYSQYSINAAEYPVVGTSSTFLIDTTGSVSVDLKSAGGGQTWNFTQELSGLNFNTNYLDPKTTAYADTFPSSTVTVQSYQWFSIDAIPPILPEPIDTLISISTYEKVEENSVTGLGVGIVTPIFAGAFPFEKPAKDFALPMQLGTNWLRHSIFNPSISVPIEGIGNVTVNLEYSDSSIVEVDAYGSLTIPVGTFECLRLKVIHYAIVGGTIVMPTITLPIPPIAEKTIEYEWHTKNAGMILYVISQTNETNPNFTDAATVVRLTANNILTAVECEPSCRNLPVPFEYSLNQNYPNPFNPSTLITYTLSQPAKVDLKVFSILGQEVATLESEIKTAGTQELIWNGKDNFGRLVPSGIYYYQLKAFPLSQGQSYVQTKKMIMTK